uniref:Apoptosis-inducing factor 1, mitochondrial n=1 Tax=Cacopsylla melanoneura TaxID=428564 RepID=A0A8D8XGE1_9HEMI
MSRNLKAFGSLQCLLRSTNKRYLPSVTWGFHKQATSYYSTQDGKSNSSDGSFKKYGFGLLAAFGALFAAYQFNVIPGLGKDDGTPSDGGKKRFKRPSKVFKYPKDSSSIPDKVPYLLIGGGTASFSAFRAIKSADPTAKVLVIGNEPFNPYMRPPLSKEMFYNEDRDLAKNLRFKQWNTSERSLFYEPDDFYTPLESLFPPTTPDQQEKEKESAKASSSDGKANVATTPGANYGGVTVVRGWQVTQLDTSKKVAILEDGKAIHFDKCLLATGATPKNLAVFEQNPQAKALKEKITVYRNVLDFQELESVIETGAKAVAVVGGGFLGSELACALAKRGGTSNTQVYQIFPEKGNMARILPAYLSAWTTNKVEEEGVHTLRGITVEAATLDEANNVDLKLSDGQKLKVDHVVVAVGVEPNTQLAKGAGLETDPERGGFLVNSELSARSDIYAAGDCACFYDQMLGRRRVEHHDHAVVSGRLAGENMAGAHKHYWHQSMFWSDLGPKVGYEAIGIVDSSLPTVGVYAKSNDNDTPQAASLSGTLDRSDVHGDKATQSTTATPTSKAQTSTTASSSSSKQSSDYGKGVIFYLRNDIVVGIVLWNVFNRMSVARQVLKSERKYEDLNEVAKLFNIHTE